MNTYQVFSVHNTLISAHDNAAAALKHALIYQHATGKPAHVEQVPAAPVGASCVVEFDDGDIVDGYYFSFGDYKEETETDSYGVNDDRIFYYCDGGEAELIELMRSEQDFKILSYELEYRTYL